MNNIFKKINFKQPKYIFPLVIALPLGTLLYILSDLFGSFGKEEDEGPTDFINTQLPEPNLKDAGNKLSLMNNKFEIDETFGALGGLDKVNETVKDTLYNSNYSDEEMQAILAQAGATEEEIRQMQEAMNSLQRSQSDSERRNQSSGSRSRAHSSSQDDEEEENPYKEYEEMQQRNADRMAQILNRPDPEEILRAERERVAREERERKAAEEPTLQVHKADNYAHTMFNSVSATQDDVMGSPLIKAMIDQTTKSTDGTRLRFKLLDDVIIEDIKIKKGTYLYGTVSGFTQQRVMVNIQSILLGDMFLKVNLSVYDLDGMEGFYVPQSSFREFFKNATSTVASQSINFNDGASMGSGINGESIALQAIQNVYQAMSGAISGNLRKNKAKIKYNTIVYLINSKNN